MGAQVTMSLAELDELRGKLMAAREEAGKLQAKLTAALAADPEGRVTVLIDAIRAVLPIIRFAVANIDPRTMTRWPYEDLRNFAKALRGVPAFGADIEECAIEFEAFSREAELIELDRAERGVYEGPDPIDLRMLVDFATGGFTRVGALVDAGYIDAEITDEGRAAIREIVNIGSGLREDVGVAHATKTA
jgi:hypothetical protein